MKSKYIPTRELLEKRRNQLPPKRYCPSHNRMTKRDKREFN